MSVPQHGLVVSRTDGSNRWRLTPSGQGRTGKKEEGWRRREGGCLESERENDGDGQSCGLLSPLASKVWKAKWMGMRNGRREGELLRRERHRREEEKMRGRTWKYKKGRIYENRYKERGTEKRRRNKGKKE